MFGSNILVQELNQISDVNKKRLESSRILAIISSSFHEYNRYKETNMYTKEQKF